MNKVTTKQAELKGALDLVLGLDPVFTKPQGKISRAYLRGWNRAQGK